MTKRNNPTVEAMIAAFRESWLDMNRKELDDMYVVLEQAYERLRTSILDAQRDGVVPPARLGNLYRQVVAEMRSIRPKLTRRIRKLQKKAILESFELAEEAAQAAGMSITTGIAWDYLNTQAFKAVSKYTYGGIPLTRRIWDLTWISEKAIRNRIQTGVLLGDSADDIARDIKPFLLMKKTPTGKELADYRPGSGVYKSAWKNAYRLARTEINRAFVEGQYEYFRRKQWIDGWIWRTGSGNPCPICAPEDGTFYPKESMPIIPAHPNCMCYPEPHYT